MNATSQKSTMAEFQAELDELSLRRVRVLVDGMSVMVTLIDRPDEYPIPGEVLPDWGHRSDKGGEV